jgi:hypothetical protein
LKSKITYILFLLLAGILSLPAYSQRQKIKNRPFADQKLYHLGFTLGLHGQDLILSHTGNPTATGETWFAEIPSHSPGFTVGIIGDRYLNQYMNLRVVPSLSFGEKEYVFREQNSGQMTRTTIRSNYVTLPVYLKFSSERNNNMRPYLLAGAFGSLEIGSKKDVIIKQKKNDFGLEIGFGCDFYLPMFKFAPELRFSFGLRDLIEKDRSDLTDKDAIKYTDALASGKSRMITLTFNFE